MANAQPPPIQPRTGLWGLGLRLELIALRFNRMYEEIKDVWLIGRWLSWPFYILSLYFQGAKTKTWEADDVIVDIRSWVYGIIEGNTLLELLGNLWGDFTLLRTNPIDWIRLRLDTLSSEYRALREDPLGWIRARVFIAIPALSSIIYSSGYWIYTKLSAQFPNIGGFITNPVGRVRAWVLSNFPFMYNLSFDATQAIINWLQVRTGWFSDFIRAPVPTMHILLRRYSFDLSEFLVTPVTWFRRKLAGMLGVSYADMVNLPIALIKRIFVVLLANQSGILTFVEREFCNLIMRFI